MWFSAFPHSHEPTIVRRHKSAFSHLYNPTNQPMWAKALNRHKGGNVVLTISTLFQTHKCVEAQNCFFTFEQSRESTTVTLWLLSFPS